MGKKKAGGNKGKLIRAKAKRKTAYRSNKTMYKRLIIKIKIEKIIKKKN